jgi:hypothetical protein
VMHNLAQKSRSDSVQQCKNPDLYTLRVYPLANYSLDIAPSRFVILKDVTAVKVILVGCFKFGTTSDAMIECETCTIRLLDFCLSGNIGHHPFLDLRGQVSATACRAFICSLLFSMALQ